MILNFCESTKKIDYKIFALFLYLQPFLDIIAGISLHFGYNLTISSIIRFIIMFICIIYLFFYIKDKKTNIYLIFLFLYFLLFMLTMYEIKGISYLILEFKNLLSTYYFIIILLTSLTVFKKRNFDTKNIFIIYFIYLILLFIPNILGIGFNSYSHSKDGNCGWFSSANVVGSILSLLLPLILSSIKKLNIKTIILIIINLYTIFNLGTKVPVLSFFIIIIINVLYYIIYSVINKNYKKLIHILLPIMISFIFFIFLLPKTTFYKNINIHLNFLENKYNNKISIEHIIDHFIFSERITFKKQRKNTFVKSSMQEKLFGIGYINLYSNSNFKTVEIDYFDILYSHGIIGFILFFIPIISIIIGIIRKIRIDNKYKMNELLSTILIFSLALFQGHIFVTPSISIYAALILSLANNNNITIKN